GLAAASGPLLGGALVQGFGWRSIFLANLPVLALAAPLVRRVGDPGALASAVRFDWLGSVLVGAGLVVAVGASKTGGVPPPGLVAGPLVLLVPSLWWERRVTEPVLDRGLSSHELSAAGGTLVALHNVAMYALLFQLPRRFADLLGSSTAAI